MKRKTLKFAGLLLGAALLTAGVAVSNPESTEAATYAKTITVTDSDYGANGSDSAGDSAAIQKALNEATKTDGTLLVKVPAGTYYIDACLSIYSDTTLQLEDGAKFVRNTYGEAMLSAAHVDSSGKYCSSDSCTHGGYTQIKNVTITGGVWDGNGKANPSKMYSGMFYFCHGQNLNITNTTLTNNTGMHMIVMDAMKDVTISGTTFSNCVFYTGTEGKADYYTSGSINVANMTEAQKRTEAGGKEVIHMDFASTITSDATPADNSNCQNIKVSGCTFDNVFAGVGSHHDEVEEGLMHKNYTIDNCTFTNILGEVCTAYRLNGLTVTNNVIDNASYTINTLKAYNINISNNTIKNNKTQAIWLNKVSGVVKNNTITGLSSTATGIRGLNVAKVGDTILEVSNNTISGGENGIYFSYCSDVNISGNTISGASAFGIGAVYCESVTVNNNKSTNTKSGNDITVMDSKLSAVTSNTVTTNPLTNISYNNDTVFSGNKAVNLCGWGKNSAGLWCYYKNNAIDTSYTNVVKPGTAKDYRYIKNGVEATTYTGLAKNNANNTWWYIKNGKIDFSYSGLAQYNGSWWRISGGNLDFSYKGFCKWNGTWWCIVNGRYDSSKANTLYKNSNGTWYYIKEKGKIDFSYTGLVKYNNTWWYVKNGTLDFGFTGIGKNKSNGTWWRVEKGIVNFKCNTFIQYNGYWYNIKGGRVDFAYSGLKKFGNSWWYVRGGIIDKSVTAPVKYNGNWYAVINGKVNFTYTGYLSNKSGKFQFKNGKICFS